MKVSDDQNFDWQALRDEDFSELNKIMTLVTTDNIEEISELYQSFNSNNGSDNCI